MKHMAFLKKLFCLPAAILLLSAGTLSAQRIRSIDVDVYIRDDGNAFIKQVWDVDVVRGTEWYIPIENLGGMDIRGLKVEENGEEFIDEGREWNSDRTLEQKAGRSGIIVKKDGVELCWGQGSYGHHVWTASFVALGLVQSLEDYDAFNFMFINPDLVAAPEKVSLTFYRLGEEQFSFDFTRFWFFGTEGESELREDGSIHFEAKDLLGSDSVICMMRFDKGHFTPSISKGMKFKKMEKRAFKGSTYKAKKGFNFNLDELFEYLAVGVTLLIFGGLVLLVIVFFIRDSFLKMTGHIWKESIFGSTKPKGWAREAPFGGSIPIASYLLKDCSRLALLSPSKTENCIGAYFLKWIQEGIVVPVKAKDDHYDLKFPGEMPDFADDAEKALFQKALAASGSNLILEKGEFDSWAKKHYSSLTGWPSAIVKEGRSKISLFQGDKTSEAAKLLQFKNFLKEFTLSHEREVPEVGLWGQYLVFAQIFGFADKVAKGFAKMYPEQFNDYSRQYGLDAVTMQSVMHSWTNSARKAYKAAYDEKLSRESSKGSGGSSGGYGGGSSRGGGGGYSGGGRGGGSR